MLNCFYWKSTKKTCFWLPVCCFTTSGDVFRLVEDPLFPFSRDQAAATKQAAKGYAGYARALPSAKLSPFGKNFSFEELEESLYIIYVYIYIYIYISISKSWVSNHSRKFSSFQIRLQHSTDRWRPVRRGAMRHVGFNGARRHVNVTVGSSGIVRVRRLWSYIYIYTY